MKMLGFVFETEDEMIEDTSLKSGILITTFGKHSVDDKLGATYKLMKIGEDQEVEETDIKLKNGLYARPIILHNSSQLFQTAEKSIEKVEESTEENSDAFSELLYSLSNHDIMNVLSATNIAGIKIIGLVCGHNGIAVTDINKNETPSDNIDQKENEDGTFEIEIPIDDSRKWMIPIEFFAIPSDNTTMKIVDGLYFTYDKEESKLKCSIDRNKLEKKIYYYL